MEASGGGGAAESARRGAIDVARVGALAMVVLGHLTLAVIDRGPDGALRGSNLLALHPGQAWLAMLAPMPVFFAAAGWANARSTPRTAVPRVRTLVGLGAVVVTVWSLASVVELLVRGEGGIVADGARIATQPLWFVAAYVPLAAVGSRLARLATRPVAAVGSCLVVLSASDVARFGLGAPRWLGWPGFFVAWSVPWLLGAWWRQRWQHSCRENDGLSEQRAGAALAAAAVVAAALLVWLAGYNPALIDAVPGKRSNTTPPTLFTAIAGIVQVGVLMVVAGALDGWAGRRRRFLDRAGEAAVGVYAWHLTALALCAAALAAGLWAPERFSVGWWATRPVWFAAVLAVTGLLVAATAWARATLRREGAGGGPTDVCIALGLLLATFGAGVVGLVGPRTLPAAVAAMIGFDLGWYCLRGRRRSEPTTSGGEGQGRPA